MKEELKSNCEHQCTSSCQKDTDCPCVQDHYCKNSPDYCRLCKKKHPEMKDPKLIYGFATSYTDSSEKWEEEFDKGFPYNRLDWEQGEYLKSFIRQKLTQQRSKIVEKLEAMMFEGMIKQDIDDIITAITNDKE